MFHKAKPGLPPMFGIPYWRILTAFLIISTIALLSYWATPEPVSAIQGIVPDEPFGVELTETLISLDLCGTGLGIQVCDPNIQEADPDGDTLDTGDVRQNSGYTFTVQSEKAFTPEIPPLIKLTKMTVTFPKGIDLVEANDLEDNYELYDPNDPLGPRFEPAFHPNPTINGVLVNPAGAFGGGTIELRFGNLAPPGLLPGIIPGVRGDNITVRIKETANIGNPLVSSSALDPDDIPTISVDMDNGDAETATSRKLFFGSRITLTPDEPGVQSEIKVAFYATNDMDANDGKIIMTFDDDFGTDFPRSIPPSTISIRADRILLSDGTVVTEATVGITGAQANQLVNPTNPPSFKVVGTENDQPQLTITIPDMDPAEVAANTGAQGIAKDALVTVTYSTASGIEMPTEALTPFQFGEFHAHEIIVRTTDDKGGDTGTEDDGDKTEFQLPRVLNLSSDEGSKGDSIQVFGKGFKNGSGVTVFLDRNGDGRFDVQSDSFLASALVDSDDNFITEFTVDDGFSADPNLNQNQVNAIDGEGNSVCRFAIGSPGICDVDETGDIVRFELEASATVTPDHGGPVFEFHITLRDFPGPGSTISSISLGGFPVRASDLKSLEGVPLNADGGATIKALVPRNLPAGKQILRVNVLSPPPDDTIITADAAYNVESAKVELTPAKAVPDMNITISGSGFIPGGVICASGISIGGEVLKSIPTHSADGSGSPCDDGEDFVRISSGLIGPAFVVTVPVPPVESIFDAGITGEEVEVKVSDIITGEIVGVTAITFLEIAKRELTVEPPFSVPGSLLTIKGTGFPADNSEGTPGFSPSVVIRYEGDRVSQNARKTPDAAGNFITTLTVPTKAIVPSDNAIEATVNDLAGGASVTTTIHIIPGPLIRVEPANGPSGSLVTVAGGGFPRFGTVESVEFGGLGALGNRTVTTDGAGNLLIPGVLIPHLELVVVDLVVDVNGITATTAFKVTDSGEGRGAPATQVTEGLLPLGDSLERVFYFNNFTKVWTFYDPRSEFADANTLGKLVEGQVYWLKLTEDIQADLNGRSRRLNCVLGDCWNQMVW